MQQNIGPSKDVGLIRESFSNKPKIDDQMKKSQSFQ
jgi:hypothetical protein